MREKKHREQPKGHTDEKRDRKKGFGRLEIKEDVRWESTINEPF